jgi:hypothetical protein
MQTPGVGFAWGTEITNIDGTDDKPLKFRDVLDSLNRGDEPPTMIQNHLPGTGVPLFFAGQDYCGSCGAAEVLPTGNCIECQDAFDADDRDAAIMARDDR